jgi:site-specific DNA-methyltransferase (adenine-specific)/site-specific DNA-methyltransferase (cytosine-N4-specific)
LRRITPPERINIKPASNGLDVDLYVLDLILAHVREWGWHLSTEFCWERIGIPGKPKRRFKNQFEPIYQFTLNEWKFRPEAVQTISDSSFKYEGIEKNWDAKSHQGKKNMLDRETFEGLAYPGNRLPTFSGSHEKFGHGAAFPVGLPEWFMKAYTDNGDSVYDPFMGTGSTLIASERTQRKCYGMEISPAYCDIIIQRWEKLTGLKAHLKEG